MVTKFITVLSCVLLLTSYSYASEHNLSAMTNTQEKDQEYYIVCLKEEHKDMISNVIEELQEREDFLGDVLELRLIHGFAVHLSADAKEWLEGLECVNYIELDGRVETQKINEWKMKFNDDTKMKKQ